MGERYALFGGGITDPPLLYSASAKRFRDPSPVSEIRAHEAAASYFLATIVC